MKKLLGIIGRMFVIFILQARVVEIGCICLCRSGTLSARQSGSDKHSDTGHTSS